jgi:PAS domain S-box-containing protein
MQNGLVKKARLGAQSAYPLAVGASIVALLVRLPFSPVLHEKAPYATFLVAAGAVASVGGFGPALLVSGLGAIFGSVFILQPLNVPPDFLTIVVFLLLSGFVSFFCARLANATRQENAFRLLFQQTFVSIGDGVISTDNDGRVRLMNPVAEQLTGWTEAEAAGKQISEVFRIVRGNSNTALEIPLTDLIGKSGARIPIDDSVSPFRDEKGAIVGTVLVFRDVKERRKAEAALKNSEEQLRVEREQLARVFSQAPVAIVVLRGRDLFIELANPLYHDLLPGRLLTGRPIAQALPELGNEVIEALHRVLDTGEPFAANDWHLPYDKDGDGRAEDHWFNLVYHPLRGNDRSVDGIVAVMTEVTSQVLARKELERVNRELEEFAYVASHDLQEPLRMVNIFTQKILKRAPDTDETLALYAGFVRQGVSRMDALIQGLLTYSRTIHKDDLPVGTANLSQALADAATILETRIEDAHAKITCTQLPTVRGDTPQLSHVLQNLLSNALKYRRKDVPLEIMVSAAPEDARWVISVKDNGIGFEQQFAERIFGLFKRLHKDEYDGTGLGLAICQRIVERYGGRVWAESRPGEGATFYFSLPRIEEEEANC